MPPRCEDNRRRPTTARRPGADGLGLLRLLLLLIAGACCCCLPRAQAFLGTAPASAWGKTLAQRSSRVASSSTRRSSSSEYYGRSFQPLGSPVKKPEPEVAFVLGRQNDSMFEESIVNITKPLGIAVEEAMDGSGMVYVVEHGDKAAEAGVEVGDVIVGCSFIFDDLFLVNVTAQGTEKVESLIRSRGPDYVCLRLRKGCEYHLADRAAADARKRAAAEDDDALLEPEQREARWIRLAQSIFVDDFPMEPGVGEGEEEDEEETW